MPFFKGILNKKCKCNFEKDSIGGDIRNEVYKLKKYLYVLKQASRQWNFKITKTLLSSGVTTLQFN